MTGDDVPPDVLGRIAGGFADKGGADSPQSPLFRREALEAATLAGFGQPISVLPLSWAFLSALLLLMVVTFGVFLVTGTYSRKETVNGVIRAVGGEVRVQVPAAGTVTGVAVTEGQWVRGGETLLTVTTARTSLDGQLVDAAALASVDSEIASLSRRLARLDAAAAVETRGQTQRLAALAREAASAAMVEDAIEQRLALAEAALAKIEPVAAKGFISGEAMRKRREEIIALRQGIAEAAGRSAGLAGEIDLLRATRDHRPYDLVDEKGRLTDQIEQARRQRGSYAVQNGYALKAPASGTVTALQVTRGQMVEPQRSLMTISAPRSGVTAEIYVPSRAIGFLEPGQLVRVRYDAFPFERFGSALGRITAVSATVLRPDDVQAPVDVKEPMYRVLVRLDRDSVSAYGRQYRVLPGFALSADIVLEDRSFANWLFDPFVAMKGRL